MPSSPRRARTRTLEKTGQRYATRSSSRSARLPVRERRDASTRRGSTSASMQVIVPTSNFADLVLDEDMPDPMDLDPRPSPTERPVNYSPRGSSGPHPTTSIRSGKKSATGEKSKNDTNPFVLEFSNMGRQYTLSATDPANSRINDGYHKEDSFHLRFNSGGMQLDLRSIPLSKPKK